MLAHHHAWTHCFLVYYVIALHESCSSHVHLYRLMSIREFRCAPFTKVPKTDSCTLFVALSKYKCGFMAHDLTVDYVCQLTPSRGMRKSALCWFDWCENEPSLGSCKDRASHGLTVANSVCESCCVCVWSAVVCSDLFLRVFVWLLMPWQDR